MKKYFFIYLVVVSTNLSAQTIWYVNATATGTNTGQSWDDAFTNLHDALSHAESGSAVWVAEGVYFPDNTGDRDRSFVLKSGVKLYGGFAGSEISLHQRQIAAHPVTLSGNIGNAADSTDNAYTILYLAYPDSSTRIDGLEFRHGYASNDTNFVTNVPTSSGGAVFIMAQNGTALPIFANCTFRDNAARFNGGAIYVQGQGAKSSMPLFQNCRFINNKARLGGAIYLYGGSKFDRGIEFDHCSFESNQADFQGGAVYYYNQFGQESLEIIGCNISNNKTTSFGAFMEYHKTSITPLTFVIDSSLFANNVGNTIVHSDNIGIEFKSKFLLSNSYLINNKIPEFFGSSNVLFSIENVSLGNFIDTFMVVSNYYVGNISLGLFSGSGYNIFSVCTNNFAQNNLSGLSMGGNSIIYSNNIILDSGPCFVGFNSENLGNHLIANNIFINTPKLGVWFYESPWSNGNPHDTMNIINNVFYGCETAINQLADTNHWHINVVNNIFSNNQKTFQQDNSSMAPSRNYAFFSHNVMADTCGLNLGPRVACGLGNIRSTDPMYVDPFNLNFHLKPCSPAVDAGNNQIAERLAILSDFSGAPRIQGGRVDIGAYESPAFALAAAPELQPACGDAANGSILIHPADGCEPYTYHWQPPAGSGPSLTGLPAGQYAYTVTDGRGRQISDLVAVSAVPTPDAAAAAENISCGDQQGGAAEAEVNGGTAPYAYHWSTGADTERIEHLAQGTYTVAVTDANGCKDSVQIAVARLGQLTLQVDGEPISCFGAADGMLSAAALNGLPPMSYLWSQGHMDSLLTDLGPGQYAVTVTDTWGCTASFAFNLNEPAEFRVSAAGHATGNTQMPDGSASVTGVQGGTPPYAYAWSNGEAGLEIGGLGPGTYTVTATDGHGCTATATAVVILSGVEDVEGLEIQVWPNPAADWLTLHVEGLPEGGVWLLRDALGRELRRVEAADRSVMDLRGLPAGAYAWEVYAGGLKARGRVVKW